MRAGVLSALPYPIQILVGLMAYRENMQTLQGQGTARFSPEEIESFKIQIWRSISDLLVLSRIKNTSSSGNDYVFWILGTDQPTEADATVFGFICSAFVCSAYVSFRSSIDSETNQDNLAAPSRRD